MGNSFSCVTRCSGEPSGSSISSLLSELTKAESNIQGVLRQLSEKEDCAKNYIKGAIGHIESAQEALKKKHYPDASNSPTPSTENGGVGQGQTHGGNLQEVKEQGGGESIASQQLLNTLTKAKSDIESVLSKLDAERDGYDCIALIKRAIVCIESAQRTFDKPNSSNPPTSSTLNDGQSNLASTVAVNDVVSGQANPTHSGFFGKLLGVFKSSKSMSGPSNSSTPVSNLQSTAGPESDGKANNDTTPSASFDGTQVSSSVDGASLSQSHTSGYSR